MNAKWDCRFLDLAEHIAQWSKDPSTKVGAVIVRPDKTIASVGFNGLPRGIEDTDERLTHRGTKYALTIHAESNAVLHAREPLEGHTLYTWPFQPCSNCAVTIIQTGIHRIVAPAEVPDRWFTNFMLAREIFLEAGVELELLS